MAAAVNMAPYKCPPTFVLAGFIKAASSSLFLAATQHPQLLRPWSGPDFKEPAGYTRVDGSSRPADYPVIEAGESFLSADGSVENSHPSVDGPSNLHKDNPHAKIVFVVRDPVHRVWSDFMFQQSPDYERDPRFFTKLVEKCLPVLEQCLEEGVDEQSCFKACPEDSRQLIIRGVYYPQIMRFVRTFGLDRVLVLSSDDIKADMQKVLDRLYAFLGLCPFTAPLLPDYFGRVSKHKAGLSEMSAETYRALRRFYAPWNDRLADLLGGALDWNNRTYLGIGDHHVARSERKSYRHDIRT